jgi:hypothetical protein
MLLGAFGSGRKEILARTPARDSCRPCRRTAGRGTNDAGGAVGRSTVTRPSDHASADGDPDPVPVPWSIEKRRTRARVIGRRGRLLAPGLGGGDPPLSRCRGHRAVERSADRRPARTLRARGFRGEPSRTAEPKERIARFLHARKGAAGFSMSPAAWLRMSPDTAKTTAWTVEPTRTSHLPLDF